MKRLKIKDNKYFFICLAITVLAIISRFIFLSAKPLHHDEGMLSYFAWRLSHFGEYVYTPQIHAPILFYVQALLYLALGVSDTISKVGPAIFGVLLVIIPLFFHKLLSKGVAVFMSVGFLISPIFLYYSRFLVHTAIVVVFWLLCILFFYQFIKKQRASDLYLSFAFLALGFGTSETSYIFVAAIALYFFCLALFFPKTSREYFTRWWKIFVNNYLDFITAALIFILLWSTIYSVGFTDPKSLHNSLPILNNESTGLGFWFAQHPKRLGGQPWHYYLMLAMVYETIFVFGSLGYIYKFLRNKKTASDMFVVIWLIGSMVAYSWAGEKFPWLFLPSLLPMVFATALYLGRGWQKFNKIAKVCWIIAALWTSFVAIRLVYLSPADTNELAVYVQTPNNFQQKIDQIAKDCQDSLDTSCVLIDQNISWPLSWSFRTYSTLIITNNYTVSPNTKYLIIGSEDISSAKKPEGMKEESMQIRDWWVPDKCRGLSCIGKYLKYYFFRQTWNGKGGYDVYIYSR